MKVSKSDQKELRKIAAFYGCKVRFKETSLGFFCGDYIVVPIEGHRDFDSMASVFFHELTHFINFHTGKYSYYHNFKDRRLPKKYQTIHSFVKYALEAEIYTDKEAAKLMKWWIPSGKFYRSYYKNRDSYKFLFNYYNE